MLTEAEVQRSFRKLFTTPDVPEENFTKAEDLIDKLRYESPLRHRLSEELDELRKMRAGAVPAPKAKAKPRAKAKA